MVNNELALYCTIGKHRDPTWEDCADLPAGLEILDGFAYSLHARLVSHKTGNKIPEFCFQKIFRFPKKLKHPLHPLWASAENKKTNLHETVNHKPDNIWHDHRSHKHRPRGFGKSNILDR